MAVKETGMGIVEDKVIKNHYAAEYIYNAYRDTRTCVFLIIEALRGKPVKREHEGIVNFIGMILLRIPRFLSSDCAPTHQAPCSVFPLPYQKVLRLPHLQS